MSKSRAVFTTTAAFARLRDEICLRAGLAPGVIMIASARREEGRTTVAAGLAEAFGRILRAPALLVDLDLARPALHELFGVPVAPGVSDLLREECDLGGALRRVGDGTISLLPAGSRSEDAGALVASPRMSWLMGELRGQAEAVIADAPPVEAGVQARVLAALAESVVLVVCADRTTERDAHRAYAGLAASRGVNVVGVVLNAVRRGKPAVASDLGVREPVLRKAPTPAPLPRGSETRAD